MPTLSAIRSSQEYIDDYAMLTEIAVNSIANEDLIDSSNVFIQRLADIRAIARYYIRHVTDQKDIDKTQFLSLIQQEVGLGLPLTQSVPILEFIRENKRWFGHKGSEVLYDFIGSLIGSPIEIDYPSRKIFTLDSLDTLLDGAPSDSGPLPFNESKIGYIHDGIYYAQFTYVVRVLQTQNIPFLSDLEALLDSIHPSGAKEFLNLINIYLSQGTPSTPVGAYAHYVDSAIAERKYIGLDNGLYLDSSRSLLDGLGNYSWVNNLYIREARDQAFAFGGRTVVSDSLLHTPISYQKNAVFYKERPNSLTPIPTSIWGSLNSGSTLTMDVHILADGIPSATFGGTITDGDVITITIYDPSLPGGSHDLTYTLNSSVDTDLLTMVSNIAADFSQDTYLLNTQQLYFGGFVIGAYPNVYTLFFDHFILQYVDLPPGDEYLESNLRTNASFSTLLYEDIENLIYEQIELCAYSLDGKNPPTKWYPDLLPCTIVETTP